MAPLVNELADPISTSIRNSSTLGSLYRIGMSFLRRFKHMTSSSKHSQDMVMSWIENNIHVYSHRYTYSVLQAKYTSATETNLVSVVQYGSCCAHTC